MYEQGNGAVGMAPNISPSSELPGYGHTAPMPPPPTLSEAFAALAGLRQRLHETACDLAGVANELHGESAKDGGRSGGSPARAGLVGGFCDVAADCHSLVADLEAQAKRIHAALGL